MFTHAHLTPRLHFCSPLSDFYGCCVLTCNIITVKPLNPFINPPPPSFCLVQPYLKSWSQDLGVPILSVDYSLAPEAPFPRALEECFYAYCWALRNPHLLGTCTPHTCVCIKPPGFTKSLHLLRGFIHLQHLHSHNVLSCRQLVDTLLIFS